MTRRTFDQELNRLEGEVLALGNQVEEALVESVAILKRRDFAASRQLIEADRAVNERRYAIESEVLTLIATQQPMAGDLRLLAAILEIVTELERMGDYAKGIARINLMIGEKPLLKPLIDLPIMADKVRAMLNEALEAFVRRDADSARTIPAHDDEVDALYNQIQRELLTYILADPHTFQQANYLLWAAHNLERAADRVINLCERVVYTVTGEFTELGTDDTGIESVT